MQCWQMLMRCRLSLRPEPPVFGMRSVVDGPIRVRRPEEVAPAWLINPSLQLALLRPTVESDLRPIRS